MTTQLHYQRILVATDFSASSEAALQHAIWIARKSGAEITLVHVVPDLRTGMHSASVDVKLDLLYGEGSLLHREMLSDCDRRLEQLISTAAAPDVTIRPKILSGTPFVEICRAVQQTKVDLVIAGKHSSAAWQTLLVGSTAKRLIRKCPAPVWVTKPDRSSQPKAVLVATDFSEVSKRAALAGLEFAEATAAEYHLLHVVDSNDVPENAVAIIPAGSSLRTEINEAAKERFNVFLDSLKTRYPVRSHLSWGTPWKEVVRHIHEYKVDLLAIGTVGRSGIPGLLIGNTAEKLLSSCECNVLTIKPEGFKCPIPLVEARDRIYDRTTVMQ